VYGASVQVSAPNTLAAISNLLSNTTYYFAAKSVDSSGVESDFSNEISYVTPAGANHPPTIDGPAGLILAQNAGPQIVALTGITSGAINEVETLKVTAKSSNTARVPNPAVSYTSPNAAGTLVFTPVTNAAGWATIYVMVQDGSLTSTQSFWVLLNNPPTLDALPDIVINEDDAVQRINLTGISSGGVNENQTLWIGATSSNTKLIPNPVVNYTSPNATGALTFVPVANAYGTAIITVTAMDDQYGNNTITRSFVVTVNPINDRPTLNAIGSMTADGGVARIVSLSGITSGAANEMQPLVVTATSSNPLLIPTPVVAYTSPNTAGTLNFTPASNAAGTATITVTVNDSQVANNLASQSFTVTVGSAPKISGVTATTTDARSMVVAWNTDRQATCYLEYGTNVIVDMVSGQTFGTTHSVVLTNLQPGTLYYLRVTATTPGGAVTQVATANTEVLQVIQLSAESGQLSGPIKISSSTNAQNGKYIATSNGNGSGTATYSLNLLRGPNYRVWARLKTSAGGGTFSMAFDGAAQRSVFAGDRFATNQLHWALLMDDSNRANAAIFSLEQGTHTLASRIGANIWMDEFIISNDPTWQPILGTTQPALTAVRTSATTAGLAWSDPSGNATAVAIEYSVDGVNFARSASVPAPASSITVGNLAPQTYYFRVYSYNSVDRTANSNVAVVLTF
jgi:hypothetical protein